LSVLKKTGSKKKSGEEIARNAKEHPSRKKTILTAQERAAANSQKEPEGEET